MTITNTNNLEVLFQDLCEEETASISGGLTTATASVSGNGTSSLNATATVVNSSPTASSTPGNVIKVFGLDSGFDNPSLLVRTVNNDIGNFSLTVSLTQPNNV